MIRRRNAVFSVLIGLLAAGMTGTALASETASATLSPTSLDGGEFQYNIALTNTSTDSSNIGTFWFAWVPGSDFMQVMPTSIKQPTGWGANITGLNNASDGNAIQWVASSNLLAAGATDDFSFDSTETLSQLFGPSPYGTKPIETTSLAYTGAPFSDYGFEFVVPEPASASLLVISDGGLLLRRGRIA